MINPKEEGPLSTVDWAVDLYQLDETTDWVAYL